MLYILRVLYVICMYTHTSTNLNFFERFKLNPSISMRWLRSAALPGAEGLNYLFTSSTPPLKSFVPPPPQCFLSLKQSTLAHFIQLPQPNQQHLLSLLLKNPTRNQCIQIHSQLITSGLHQIDETETGVMMWNTLLREYSQGLFPEESLQLYKQLHEISHFSSDTFTFSFLLKACANLNQPIKGTQVHGHVIKFGCEIHLYVQTALVNMYLVCGCLVEGIKVFEEMPERNSVTWNAMITGLTKLGELSFARSLFEQMPDRNVISWTGIIDGYTRLNQPIEALGLFRRMMMIDGIKPTEITILAVLPAVWNLGDLHISQSIHAYSEKNGYNASDIRVTNSFIDTYSKCGHIEFAVEVFDEISAERKNLITWTSIISGLAMHGMAKDALERFNEMEKEGLKPNRITFLSVLNACSHGGLVEEGLGFFSKLVDGYRIIPDIKHYGCMVDMLGRAGMLEEAEKMVMEMPVEMVNEVIWRTLLGACSFHGNVEMGERVMKKILEIQRDYGGDYVLLSNIFAGVGRFVDAERVRKLMDERSVSKIPGLSSVDGRKSDI